MNKIFERLKEMCDITTATKEEINRIINLLLVEYNVHRGVRDMIKEQVLLEVDRFNKDNKVVYGVEIGNTCPICKIGKVMDFGGCHSCDNCGAQLKCGL